MKKTSLGIRRDSDKLSQVTDVLSSHSVSPNDWSVCYMYYVAEERLRRLMQVYSNFFFVLPQNP